MFIIFPLFTSGIIQDPFTGTIGPAAYPNTTYHDFLVGNNETAIALAKKGHEVRFVYGLDACHTDWKLYFSEYPNSIIWAWSAWKKKKTNSGSDEKSVADSTGDVSAEIDEGSSSSSSSATGLLVRFDTIAAVAVATSILAVASL